MRIEQLRILVVDDHGFQRWAVRNILTALGARHVLAAHDGASAMETLRKLRLPVDIIITDLDMPGMDGMELIRNLARERSPASLVVSSALGRGVLAGVKAMGDAYGVRVIAALEKPVSMRMLREAIEKHTARAASPAAGVDAVEIAGALHEDEIEARFEARIDVASRAVVSAQVVPAWIQPCGKITGADGFGAVKRSGLAPALSWRLLHKALPACADWRQKGLAVGLCIPVAAECLHDTAYAQRVHECASTAGIEPSAIVLQLDAAHEAHGRATMLENLSRLRMLGFGVSLPYGARLGHREEIEHAPFSELAIDIAIARAECAGSGGVVVLRTAELARRAGLAVFAQRINSRDDWNFAAALPAHTASGPALGAPLSAAAFAQETARRPTWKGFR